MTLCFSYIRFSHPSQKLGDSLRRQLEKTEAYCALNGLVLDSDMRDEGLSAYSGKNLRTGALGRFMERISNGEIPRGSVLIVEALDRLSRQNALKAFSQFAQILEAGIDIVTLINGHRYSSENIGSNTGDLFMSLGMMIGAHQDSVQKADRIKGAWKRRRLSNKNIVPSWIRRVENGYEVIEEKAVIIRRIFKETQSIGISRMVYNLNAEGVTVLNTRKRKRNVPIWTIAGIRLLMRNRTVLGEQEVGRYVDNVRIPIGEFLNLYPAVVSEEEWLRARAACEARSTRNMHGRNSRKMNNLFGSLLRCATCGNAMIMRSSGLKNKYKYIYCSTAKQSGECDNHSQLPMNLLEPVFLKMFSEVILGKEVPNSSTDINKELEEATLKAEQMEVMYEKLFLRFADAEPGGIEERNLNKLKTNHKAQVERVRKLERKIADTKAAIPHGRHFEDMRKHIENLDHLEGEKKIDARHKIALGLSKFVKKIVIHPDKTWQLELVENLPVSLPLNGSGNTIRFLHYLANEPEKSAEFFTVENGKVRLNPEKLKIPVNYRK